jgi:murein DD-endopeptidase MepM/ murein hydrolase activator NlpD
MPRSKSKSVSDEQLAANRANAAHSTGPRSPEGKARSAQNARKHGFTASTFAVVRLEDVNEIADLTADAVAVYQPVNSQELFAVERIALAQQSMLRAARLESGLFTTCLNETLDQRDKPMMFLDPAMVDGDAEATRQQNRNYLLAEGFTMAAKASNVWSLFLRYQAQAERQYRRAIEEFDRLRSLRQELPNEPIFEPQPEPTKPTCPTYETNPLAPETAVPAPPPEPASDIRHPFGATGHWPTIHRHPATSQRPPATSHLHPATGHRPPATVPQSPATDLLNLQLAGVRHYA